MTVDEGKTNTQKRKPFNFLRKTGKYLLFLIGFVVLLLIIGVIFIQTDAFNKYALEYTLDQLNESQQPRENNINAESIEGNILSGITLHKGNVTVKGDTLLSFNYLEVKYNLWGLIEKRILIEDLLLHEPVISSSRISSGDSLIWNFENLFGQVEPDTIPSVFDWDVSVENLKIENGFIRIAGDSTRPAARWKEKRSLMQFFDFNQTDVSNLNLEMNAKYYMDLKTISIKNLSFNTNSELNLHKLHFDANLNEKDNTTELWNFELITDRSDIKIYRLYAEDFNPFHEFIYEDLGNKNIDVSLDIFKFNFDDLTFFLPELNFLDSVAAVKLEAKGKYGDLYAENLQVRLPNSVINLKGQVKNLHKPDSMYLDVTGHNISINAKDITTVYKNETVNYGHIGIINADLTYRGTFTNFYSDFTLNTSAGYADGIFNLDADNEVYSGYINTRSLNLGRILKDNSLNGGLNLTAKFDGTGFGLNKMNANVVYSVTGSRLGAYDIRSSNGTINARRGNLTLNIKHASSMGSGNVSGRVNILNMKNPTYSLKGNVRNLDVSKITRNAEDKSNLTFAFNVNGRGASLDNINGTYKLDVSESRYGDYIIPQTPVDAEIRNSGANGTVSLKTDMVDFNGEGTFKVSKLVDVILYNISQVQNQIAQSTGTQGILTDSMQVISNVPGFSGENLDFKYTLVTKDSVKLGRVLKPFGIYFNGNASGNINNTPGKFTSVTKLDIKKFTYNDTDIVANNFKSDLAFDNSYTGGISGINIVLNAEGNYVSFGNNKFDTLFTVYNMQGQNAELQFRAGMDTSAKAIVNGRLNFGAGSINADLDSVYVDYGGYLVQNSGNWVFSFEQADRFKFQKFDIKSRSAILKVSGEFSFNNESDLKVEGNNLKITDIAEIVNQADSSYIISADEDIQGELSTLLLTFKGTMEEPVLAVDIKSNTLRYKDTDIGVISIDAKYENNQADATLVMNNAEGKGNLTIKGVIPYRNPLSGDTTAMNISSEPVDINFKAKDFELDYFSVLFTEAASLRGVLNADLSAKGTAQDPSLSGNLKISNGGYLLPLTGMYYNFNASVSTDNFKLVVDNIKLYNEDDESKHIDLYGSLDFKDLKIKDINLEARGDMVILDDDVEMNDLGVYGYILAGIGNPPIKVTGSLDSIFVTGQLLIKDATISSVPMEGSGYNAFEDNFVYIDMGNDSVQFNLDSMKIAVTEDDYNKLNPFEKFKYAVTGDKQKNTFINLDLNVKTEQNIYASIDFNNITRDRLFGEIKADLDIKTVDGEMEAFGVVDVAGDSYYRFYRDFKLNQSQVRFDGDITNPILDIKGVYTSQKNNEQYGSATTSEVEVVITIKGNVKKPELTLGLYQDGSQISGSDAQSDAITYLLFGRYKSELTASERSAVASTLGASMGSLYASSYLSQTIREILPFIVDAQFNYTEGNVQNTDVELISDVGDARVKFGGKLLKDVKNFEVVVDYPLNKLLNLNLPETLLLEFSREEKKQVLTTNQNDILSTEIKILYKIKF